MSKLPGHPLDRTDCVAGLSKLLSDSDPLVRPPVMLALGRYEGHGDRLMPALDAGMRSDDPRLRAAALTSLTGMRPFTPEMQSRVIAMLADKDRDVRPVAAGAEERIIPFVNGEDAKKRLRAAMVQAGPGTRE